MGRALLRVLQVTLGTVAGLLIVPIAVNVGTGGEAPGWLRPYVAWLWPVAIGCVVLIIGLEAWDKLRGSPTEISARRPNDPHNGVLALAQVARYVEGRQRGSLTERIRLALDERPDAVRQPVDLVQRISGKEFQLSDSLGIADVFEQLSESMLILGAPGAGKTTQLLDLAAALVARAGSDDAIPVIVDLADWSRSGRRRFGRIGRVEREPREFVAWLLAALRARYSIPKSVGRMWLSENRLTLLLDGLDEVRQADRARCVQEINNLRSQWGVTRVVVCSRESDYDEIAGPLRMQGALVIRPLTREQVAAYLTTVSPEVVGVAAALRGDEELWDLLTTPLMLTIMVFAQTGDTWRALSEEDATPATRRRLLFDAYVVEVLARRRSRDVLDVERTLRAVRTLALASSRVDAGTRVVSLGGDSAERILADPVASVLRTWLGPLSLTAAGLVLVVSLALRFSLWIGLAGAVGCVLLLLALMHTGDWPNWVRVTNFPVLFGWAAGVAAIAAGSVVGATYLTGLLLDVPRWVGVGILFTLGAGQVVVGTWLTWSDSEPGLPVVSLIGILGAAFVVVDSAAALEACGVGVGAGLWLAVAAMVWRGGPRLPPPSIIPPGVTVKVVVRLCAVAIIAAPVVATRWGAPFWVPFWAPFWGLVAGLAVVAIPGVVVGSVLMAQAARVAMLIIGEPVPWRRSFLRFAVDRSLLVYGDGEYRFVHLLIRDHLAECEPAKLAAAVLDRRAELAAA